MKKKLLSYFIALILLLSAGTVAKAQEAFIGEIKLVGFNFAPRGWADCDGRLLPINQNQALFALLGTMYGGDGRTTFALPDLRGRVPVGVGQGTGLPAVQQGEKSEPEKITASKKSIDASAASTTPTIGMRYVICLNGIFPSRN